MTGPTPLQADVERILVSYAEQAFPLWSKAARWDEFHNSMPWQRTDDPRQSELAVALDSDPTLQKLYPTPASDFSGRRGYLMTYLGGGTRHAISLVDETLTEAWDDSWLSTGKAPTVEGFMQCVRSAFARLLAGARGDAVTVMVRAGIGGIALPPELPLLDTPQGVVRAFEDADQWMRVRSQGLPDPGLPIRTIFESEVKLKLQIFPENGSEPDWSQVEEAPWADWEQRWRALRFALLLVSDQGVSREWRRASLGIGGGMGDGLRATSRFTPRPLTVEQAKDWRRMATLISTLPLTNIEVAVDRAAMLVDGSEHPFDQLLNSVMCWENLFGAVGDTTFRIATSVALALESECTKRRELCKTLKDTYNLRSQVVHGSKHLPPTKNLVAYGARPTTLRLLRAVIENHPGLLSMKDGAARSEAIVLGCV